MCQQDLVQQFAEIALTRSWEQYSCIIIMFCQNKHSLARKPNSLHSTTMLLPVLNLQDISVGNVVKSMLGTSPPAAMKLLAISPRPFQGAGSPAGTIHCNSCPCNSNAVWAPHHMNTINSIYNRLIGLPSSPLFLSADTVEVVSDMNLAADLLCLLLCLTVVACDRVYVHPFSLFSFNKSTCEDMENLAQEGRKTFVPASIESQTTPAYEDDLKDKVKLDTPNLSGRGRQKLSYLKDFVYVLGVRFYSELREAHRGQNVLLSPTSLYGSLVSFYLGASNQTAADLQGLLGFVPPSGDPDCTSRVDGHKVLASLRTIESLIKNRDEELLFSKTLCLFTAPGIPLSEQFVHDLFPSADAFYTRAVDFTNPSEATKQINTFVEAKSEGRSKCLLTDLDPSTDLLFAVDVRLAGEQALVLEAGWVDR